MGIASSQDIKFSIKSAFDYDKSTEENYALDAEGQEPSKCNFVGKYREERKQMDYNYHKIYSPERQLFHDALIDQFIDTVVIDGEISCEIPEENWIVFTAGPMGAGKSFTVDWLHRHKLFPLNAFVKVDPDALRDLLPEIHEYIRRDPSSAGHLTQKEVGYIAEVLTLYGLRRGKNVLVDGSLRDARWYSQYISTLRQSFPQVKVAIIHISASLSTVLKRAEQRGLITGRIVPQEVIVDTCRQIDHSVDVLAPLTDFIAAFMNEDNQLEPQLLYAFERTDPCHPANMRKSDEEDDDEGVYEGKNESCVDLMKKARASLASTSWKHSFQGVWRMTCRVSSPL